ncbi:MAG TPA: PAS domain S-box protein [Gemmatimonadales bacterium]|nr:PAS domain S-box protein [Gemmatimonadales bacterium]
MSNSPIAALGRVASLLTREEDTGRMVRAVMEEGQRLFRAQRAGLYLLDDDGNVEDVVTIGLSPAYATALRTRFHEAPAKDQLLRGEPTFIRDATLDTGNPIHQQVVEEGFAGAAALPLCYNNKTIGFLTFYHDHPRDYDTEEQILARAFADQAALAIGTRRLVDTVVRVKREWQSAFDGVGNGLALITPDGQVERANRFFSEMSGQPVTDLPGTPLARLFVDWPSGERDPLRQATSRGHRVSLFLDTPSGQHVVLTATPRPDGGYVVAVDDLTHYVRLEARYSRLVETAREAIILAGPDGRVVFANPAAAELFGVPATRLTGDSLAALLPEERAPTGGPPVSTTGSFSYEALIRRRDGVRIVDVSIAPLEERGTITGSVAVARDVTKERLAVEALRRSERRFRALFNRAPLAIFTMDRDGSFLAANRAAFRLAGVTPASLDAKLADFVLPAEWPRIQGELEHSANGAYRDFMFPFRRTDGLIRQAAAVTVPVEEKGGRRAILAIARDVTDEVELRERLTHSEKMAALGALVSGTAHELNNPLAGIAAMAQALLLERGAGDEIDRALETIRGEAMRAARIVTDLLTFARLRPLERRDVNLNQVVRDTFAATPGLAAHNVVWTLGLDPTLPSVSADPDQIRQVVTNLLVNASQAVMDLDRKEGLVRTWSTDDWVGFEVLDSGAGIPAQVLTRIFEPFFTTKTQGQGTGLGLSISHGIIRAHGGEIRGENRPEGGARFTFQLPRDPTRIARTTDA